MASNVTRHARFALAVVAIVVLAGCGPTGTAAPASPAPTSAASTASATPVSLGQLKVAIGTAPVIENLQFPYYALQNGFYKARGLDVTITGILGNVNAVKALVSGDVDVLVSGCPAAMQAMAAGTGLRVISSFDPYNDFQLWVQKGITRPKDLAGRSLAVSQPGALSFTVPKLMIEGDGGDFSKVNVVSLGGTSARLQALIAKKIDGTVLNGALARIAATYPDLVAIADGIKTLPDYLYGCEVVTEQTLVARRPALQAFVTGTMEGVRWFYDHVDAGIAISQKLLPDTKPEEIAATIKEFATNRYWNESGVLPERAWAFTLKTAQASGEITVPLDYSKYVLTDLTTEAQRVLKK